MNGIDHIYYINLDYRSDRRLQMEDWLEESHVPSEKITRISAIPTPGRGHIGATLSHCKALETFLSSSFNTCVIFEDDFIPLDLSTFWQNFQKLKDQKVDYDIVVGSYNFLECNDTQYDFLKKVKKSYTASAYVITRNFAQKLLENFKEAVQKCVETENRTGQKADEYCLDVYWEKLMPMSKWYCFYPRIGIQRESYSDIQGHITNYNA
jgi:GR25 family glycosyltransferase involved in LPS biosynthesis